VLAGLTRKIDEHLAAYALSDDAAIAEVRAALGG
jgi:hypothetical protein